MLPYKLVPYNMLPYLQLPYSMSLLNFPTQPNPSSVFSTFLHPAWRSSYAFSRCKVLLLLYYSLFIPPWLILPHRGAC